MLATNSTTLTPLSGEIRWSGPARHYPAYVGGEFVDTDQITYGVDVAALLDPEAGKDVLTRLFAGDLEVTNHPYVFGSVAVADEPLAESAIKAAAAAVPKWASFPLATRLETGTHTRRLLLEHRQQLRELLMAEGCPQVVADWQIAAVVNATEDQSLDWLSMLMDQRAELDGRQLRLIRRPDGVVCVNPPRNAPATSAILSVAVLAAGNSVVIRIPRSVPVSLSYVVAEILAPALDAVQAPSGTLNAVCGKLPPLMRQWLDSSQVDTIFYFGTSKNGRSLEQRCVAAGKKPVLELSGNDGVLVWRDADLDRAVAALEESFLASGQICMAPNYVLAHPSITEDLLARLTEIASRQQAGHPRADNATLSPVLRLDQFFSRLDEALEMGAVLVCGGTRIGRDNAPDAAGLFVEPTVLRINGLAAAATHPVVREETFFPLLSVVVPEPAEDHELLAQMIQFMNANQYGLRNSLWADDPEVIDEFLNRVRNGGNLKVNDSHLACHRLVPTHGGTGLSGGAWGEANYPILRTSRLQAHAVNTSLESPEDARVQLWT